MRPSDGNLELVLACFWLYEQFIETFSEQESQPTPK